jgi:hypothetical protein
MIPSMSRIPPTSADLHFVGNGRHPERLSFAPGRNAHDGEPFDPRSIEPAELARGAYVPHLGDPTTGTMLAPDGRHAPVPALVGRILSAAGKAGTGGTILVGAGAATAGLVAVAGAAPALSVAAVGLGLALKAVSWSVARLGSGWIEAALDETRNGVAALASEVASSHAANDNATRDIADAVGALHRSDLTPTERVQAARALFDLSPDQGMLLS